MMMGVALYVATHWILVPIMFTVLLMLLCIMVTYPCPLVVLRIVCKLTHNRHVVQVMKDDGEIIYGLARGEWGKVLTMRTRGWMGYDICLHVSGIVLTGDWVHYFWRPLDEQLQVQMQLMHDAVNWHKMHQMAWDDRYDAYAQRRLNMRQQ